MRGAETSKKRRGEAYYRSHVASLLRQYETVDFPTVHGDLLPLISDRRGTALDVGCGSGRDAAWLAANGWRVVAVDPSREMLEGATRLHGELGITWIEDGLPRLKSTLALEYLFDLILVSAVWMHVPGEYRNEAVARIASLTSDHGLVNLTIRSGPADPDRGFFETDLPTVVSEFKMHGFRLVAQSKDSDVFDRPGTYWEKLTFENSR
jgi:SAM-dependent methyltransferase